jgi:hypothetical protein
MWIFDVDGFCPNGHSLLTIDNEGEQPPRETTIRERSNVGVSTQAAGATGRQIVRADVEMMNGFALGS